ncbi:hypothetical protein AAVH_29571 [Aphelenchoides avenae]|nr:hypothetical protein AAVH_29571 [Aphelenchus avenae]
MSTVLVLCLMFAFCFAASAQQTTIDWWDLGRISRERPYYDALCASYPNLEQRDACRRDYYSANHLNWWIRCAPCTAEIGTIRHE